MHGLVSDLKAALRNAARTPLPTALAILVLGVGIGANSAMFSLVNSLLLQPLPVPDADRLVNVLSKDQEKGGYQGFSYPTYRDLREGGHAGDQEHAGQRTQAALSELTAFDLALVGLGEAPDVRRGFVSLVDDNYFSTFGVQPVIGRVFTAAETAPDAQQQVAILGYQQWQRMGGDEQVLGRSVVLNGRSFTVVGVAPRGFAGTSTLLAPEAFVPLGAYSIVTNDFAGGANRSLSERTFQRLLLIGRLATGAERADADAELRTLSARLASAYPEALEHQVFETAVPSRISISTGPTNDSPLQAVGALLLAMSMVVLLVAGLNLATLQGARLIGRRREIAVRLALGSGRTRIVRQLILEVALLAVAGGALGLAVAAVAPELLAASIERIAPFDLMIHGGADWRIVLATLGFAVVATLLVGLVPAWRASKPSLTSDLKDQGGAARRRRFGLRRGDLPVILELAFSTVLLVAAGLFVKGAIEGLDVEPGFNLDRGVMAEIDPSMLGYAPERSAQLTERLRARLAALPGVESVAVGATIPFGTMRLGQRVIDPAAPPPEPDQQPGVEAAYNAVSSGYFSTLGVRLLRGREFYDDETQPVVIVDQQLAEALFPEGEALGRSVRFATAEWLEGEAEIVGVVAPVTESLFDRERVRHVYRPLQQAPLADVHLHLRLAETATPQLLDSIREAIRAADSQLPILALRPMREHLASSIEIWTLRSAGRLFSLLAAVALVLATAGLYGVRAYSVAQRTREIGLRMAIGASQRQTTRMVLRDGLRTTVIGAGLGVVLALGVGTLLESFLYRVSGSDPVVFGVTVLALSAVAVAACYGPARRAARLDPLIALRAE